MGTYRVTGSTKFRGHAPGKVFDADLDESEEKRAIDRGSIAHADGEQSALGGNGYELTLDGEDNDNDETGLEPEEGTDL